MTRTNANGTASCAPFRLEGCGLTFGLSNASAGRRNMRGGPGCGRPARCVVKRVYTTCFTSLFVAQLSTHSLRSGPSTSSSLTMPLQHVEPNMSDNWAPHEHIEADRQRLCLSPKPTPLHPGRTSKMSSKSFIYSFLTLPTTLTFHNSRKAWTSTTTPHAPSLFQAMSPMCGWCSTWLEEKRTCTKGGTPGRGDLPSTSLCNADMSIPMELHYISSPTRIPGTGET